MYCVLLFLNVFRIYLKSGYNIIWQKNHVEKLEKIVENLEKIVEKSDIIAQKSKEAAFVMAAV
jgi:hypothetical protein